MDSPREPSADRSIDEPLDTFSEALAAHLNLVRNDIFDDDTQTQQQEVARAPLFSSKVVISQGEPGTKQYGLLGKEIAHNGNSIDVDDGPNLIYSNTNEPWSAFICGSQGSGKSHTLTSLLENCLLDDKKAVPGQNPKALVGMAFHYDQFTSFSATQYCELAYLCSRIKVRVVVAPSNFNNMKKLYGNMPGLPKDMQPEVVPFMLRQSHLNIENMMTLMNVKENDSTPLYLAVLWEILRRLAAQSPNQKGIDYNAFRSQLDAQQFQTAQTVMLDMRLTLLDSLLDNTTKNEDSIWSFERGTLTIVDLSSPFVNVGDACALFTVALNLFMAQRGKIGRVMVLDEAHKFLTATGEAEKLTDSLMAIIRQQRHLGTRVMIATQEPTLDPRLLDLCNIVIVHRFSSPAWFSVLQKHLAGTRRGSDREVALEMIFKIIVGLPTGSALVFSPTAVLHVERYEEEIDGIVTEETRVTRLKDGYVQARIRLRVTTDGGKSIVADDDGGDSSDDDEESDSENDSSSDSVVDLKRLESFRRPTHTSTKTIQRTGTTNSTKSDVGSMKLAPTKQTTSLPHYSTPAPAPSSNSGTSQVSAAVVERVVRKLIQNRVKKGQDNSKIAAPYIAKLAASELDITKSQLLKAFSYNLIVALVAEQVAKVEKEGRKK